MIGAAEPARDRDVRHDEIEVPELVQPACEETVDVLLARSQETAWSSARSVKLEKTPEDGKRRCQACSAEIRSGRAPLRSARARTTPKQHPKLHRKQLRACPGTWQRSLLARMRTEDEPWRPKGRRDHLPFELAQLGAVLHQSPSRSST